MHSVNIIHVKNPLTIQQTNQVNSQHSHSQMSRCKKVLIGTVIAIGIGAFLFIVIAIFRGSLT
jgi:hypothetical protein